MKNTLFILTLSIALSACASTSFQTPSSSAASPAVAANENERPIRKSSASRKNGALQPALSSEKVEDPLPDVMLTEDLLYKLLSSEIAFQRGDWQSAYVTLFGLAQQTRDPRIAHRAAEIALTAKQGDQALDAVRLWRSLAPHSDEATQYYLSFVVLGDNLQDAKPILDQRLREARPQTRGLLAFQMQRLLARAKDKAAAFMLLEQVLTPYLDMHEAHIALAQAAFAAGDATRAQQESRAALKLKPDSELAVLSLAQVTTDQSETSKVLADFVARYPDAREVRTSYARVLVEQKQYALARKEFEALLKEQPQDPAALYALGVLSVQTNDVASGERYLTAYVNALNAHPDEDRDPTPALLLLAQIAEERKDTDAVLKWLGQIESGDAYLTAQVKRAQVIAKRGDVAGARRQLHELNVSGEREQAQIALAEGQILRDANMLPESLTVLEAATKRFPTNADLLYDYAMVAEKSSRWDIMEAALRKIIELAPANQHAYNALGYSFAERNIRLNEAYTLIDKALSMAPEDPFIMDSMGWVQFRLGRLKEAEALLRRAYQLRPDVEIAAHLGEVLWVKGQRDDAQKLWRDAQSKDPQNDTLKSTLARLNVRL